MGAGGASGGGGGYGNAQRGRKASTPGTQVGFSEATKGTGSDPKEKVDTKEKSFGEKVGGAIKTVASLSPTMAVVKGVTNVVKGVTNSVRRGRVNTSLMGTSDYQGSTTRSNVGTTERGGDGGGAIGTSGQVVQAPTVTAPTTAEVSQATTTKAEDPIELRKRRAKAKGRSPTIMTGVTGATGSLTLGKPSLLGS